MAPADFDKEAIAITAISHVFEKGISLLRDRATAAEFAETIRLRQKGKNSLKAIATVKTDDIRGLRAEGSTEQRQKGERLFYVLDTDFPDRPHHCDVLATLPRTTDRLSHRAAWRLERPRLTALFTQGLQEAAAFRAGTISRLEINQQQDAPDADPA